MTERPKIQITLATMMAGPYFRRGMSDARSGERWAREADVWEYTDQLAYEIGRTFAVAYGDRAASFYDDDGEPRGRAEHALMELFRHVYVC